MGLVLHVGDSHVEALASRARHVAQEWGHDYEVHFRRGARTDRSIEWISELVSAVAPTDIWITLGTNDINTSVEAESQAIARVLAERAPEANVSWWGPPRITREPYAVMADAVARAFEIARTSEARASTGEIARTSGQSFASRTYFVDSTRYTRESYLRDDGVHLTQAGYAAWATRAAWESIFAGQELTWSDPTIPPAFLTALAEAESGFESTIVNPVSNATGLFQITQILLDSYTDGSISLRDLKNPSLNFAIAIDNLKKIAARLYEVVSDGGLREVTPQPDWSPEFAAIVALAHNVGLYAVLAAIREIRDEGGVVSAEDIAVKTTRPQRIAFAERVADLYEAGSASSLDYSSDSEIGFGSVIALVGAVGLGYVVWRGTK